jgi:N-acylglucosamine-6-phosphate 2-epimerase
VERTGDNDLNISLQKFLDCVKGGVIVSCQALPGEPFYGHAVMHVFAQAAMHGGACGFRANGKDDICAIKQCCNLPIIGIVKRSYDDSDVFITPTLEDVLEVVKAGADVVAVDATSRVRPKGQPLKAFIAEVREATVLPLMADVACVTEARNAAELGVDIIATTLVGNEYNPAERFSERYRPHFDVLREIINAVSPLPVIAEGHIWDPIDGKACLEMGAHAIVVGSAITRPQLITRRFTDVIGKACEL